MVDARLEELTPWINEVVEMIAETKGKSRIYVSRKSHVAKKVSRELAHKFFNNSHMHKGLTLLYALSSLIKNFQIL